MFYLSFFKFASILHAYYKKSQEIFSVCTNFEIFQKFSVKIKIFLHILIVPIRYESGKVKKVQSNKIGITIYSWTVCFKHEILGPLKETNFFFTPLMMRPRGARVVKKSGRPNWSPIWWVGAIRFSQNWRNFELTES